MSILSDSEITKLCTPPKFVITTNTPVMSNGGLLHMLPKPVDSFTHMSEDEIKKLIANTLEDRPGFAMSNENRLGVVSYRPLTNEEITMFKPMISPFIGKQVKTRIRPATAVEKDVWYANHNSTQKPANQKLGINGLEVDERILSYGLSSAGYDVRVTEDFKIFTNINTTVIDPLDFNDQCLHSHKGSYAIIPPNSYLLATTVEWFDIPNDVLCVVVGKSTLARCGLALTCTPIEPGFRGNVVIEVANLSTSPVKIYAGMGIAQFLFFRSKEPCEVSYADRGGKYQNQTGVQLAIV